MKHEVDLKKYNLRTDLVIENNDNYMNQEVSDNDDVKVTTINLNKDEASLINKKEGLYITIEFNDITDTSNKEKVQSILIDNLKKVIKEEYNSCIVVGLGNISS